MEQKCPEAFDWGNESCGSRRREEAGSGWVITHEPAGEGAEAVKEKGRAPLAKRPPLFASLRRLVSIPLKISAGEMRGGLYHGRLRKERAGARRDPPHEVSARRPRT